MLSLSSHPAQKGEHMIACKNCQDTQTVKNGFVRDKQRYKCKTCGYNFVLGDERHSHSTEVKKALCIILYSLGKASFGFLAKLLGVSRTTTYHRCPLKLLPLNYLYLRPHCWPFCAQRAGVSSHGVD